MAARNRKKKVDEPVVETGPVPEEQKQLAPLKEYDIGQAEAGLVALGRMTDEQFEMQLTEVKTGLARLDRICKELLVEGVDYGSLDKDSKDKDARKILYQDGAVQLCRMFKLVPTYKRDVRVVHATDDMPAYVLVTSDCELHLGAADGPIVGTGGGGATTLEDKYRYRWSKPACPACGNTEGFMKSKKEPEWFCWKKRGGCGETFPLNDPKVISMKVERVENPNPYELLETCVQMSDKRAFVMSTRRTTGASRLFTQDEDQIEAQGIIPQGQPEGRRIERQAEANSSPETKPEPAKAEAPAGPPPRTDEQKARNGDKKYIPPAKELMFMEKLLNHSVFTQTERNKAMNWVYNLRIGELSEQQVTEQLRRFICRTIEQYHKRAGDKSDLPAEPPAEVASMFIMMLDEK